ncbi:LytR/AlgR family response regulator transcription factor [Sphingobacterium pedocola]|uniref:Response regulatory domain-containing protein n=1 Tax=Sphingobacterium pedocola TaxID=2082722 RepID=A0ABR9T9M4_9SPHI|nr:response regulator [Sphingobacterium pedocola]MBE8722030.1 hypothetical protein [Sphingobacterium pedocola]
MEKVKVVLIDDELSTMGSLQDELATLPVFEVLGCYESVGQATAGITLMTDIPDVIFCDIQMPDVLGIDALPDLRQLARMVVFCTAHSDYAAESFKLNVPDYIVKPASRSDLLRVLTKVANMRAGNTSDKSVRYFLIKKPNRMEWEPTPIQDICLFAMESPVVNIYGLKEGKLQLLDSVSMTMREVYERVKDTELFLYANQSEIVAVDYIQKVRTDAKKKGVLLTGRKEWISIKALGEPHFKEYLRRYNLKGGGDVGST